LTQSLTRGILLPLLNFFAGSEAATIAIVHSAVSSLVYPSALYYLLFSLCHAILGKHPQQLTPAAIAALSCKICRRECV
jgi:hypothetical protein